MRITLKRGVASLLFLVAGQLLAQVPNNAIEPIENAGTASAIISNPLLKNIYPGMEKGADWATAVRHFRPKHTIGELANIKATKQELKEQSFQPQSYNSQGSTSAVDPVIEANFSANEMRFGTPPDNDIAISDSGFVVSANNDFVEFYDELGTFMDSEFWYSFLNDNSLTSTLYDPKVLYDAEEGRFILVILHGYTDATSKIVVAFSKGQNPMNGWYVYTLSGNPFNNGTWTDYPSIGISKGELFISGNLFTNNGRFDESIIYQVNKDQGYAGDTAINSIIWNGLNSNIGAFTLVPAGHGHASNYGDNMYLVSNRSGGDSRIVLWEISGDIASNPTISSSTINVSSYAVPGNANQLGSNDRLNTNDCRIQDAFYLDGIIHFVHHTDVGSGWSGVSYNRLNLSNNTVQTVEYGAVNSFDYAYPAIASYALSDTIKTIAMVYGKSSSNIYPEVEVVTCSHDMQWSNPTNVIQGNSHVSYINGTERWGDYSGMARRHSSINPEVWLASSYGGDGTSQDIWITQIAQVRDLNRQISTEEEKEPSTNAAIYPNPVYDMAYIDFEVKTNEVVDIAIYDLNGKMVKLLFKDVPKMGPNKLMFNKGALGAGTYILTIKTPSNILKNEKIIIAD